MAKGMELRPRRLNDDLKSDVVQVQSAGERFQDK